MTNIQLVNVDFLKNQHQIFNWLANYKDMDEFYVCGGYVRNQLMKGKGSSGNRDIDIFINCTPQQFSELMIYLQQFGRIEYGQYGSPRFYLDSDKENYIDLVPFYNFVVSPLPVVTVTDLLMNFDFTANAIGINIKTGEMIDPVGGIDDIRKKVLRAVRLDFPERPVSAEIHLSAVSVFWFRLLHYQKKLGFTFDERTEQWILSNAFRIHDLNQFQKSFFTPCIEETMYQRIIQCLHQ